MNVRVRIVNIQLGETMIDRTKLILTIIIVILAVAFIWVWGYPKFTGYYYDKGFSDGLVNGQYRLLTDICDDGKVTASINGTMQGISLNQICGVE